MKSKLPEFENETNFFFKQIFETCLSARSFFTAKIN